MQIVVGIRFKKAGKIYHFDPGELDLKPGMKVVVETSRGTEVGTVVLAPREVDDDEVVQPVKPVLRVATDEDEQILKENKEMADRAFEACLDRIEKHQLDMHLVDAEYTFDRSKVIFYFTADGRVDFRALVRDLAALLHTRIELRQIGVRDEAKLLGGIGPCGRILCCTSFLTDFAPVSIKMAKTQNLSLNPAKISGACGRLMCCLRYENETYEEVKKHAPDKGEIVQTVDGTGRVIDIDLLGSRAKVRLTESEAVITVPFDLMEYRAKGKPVHD